jgi:Flp pilus assembly protein TadG
VRLRALQILGQAQGGTSAIEFAFVAPAFLALLFGTIEFGRLLWTEQALQETAIAGARCMAILQSGCTAGGRYYSSANTTTYVQQVASQWGVTLQSGDIQLTPNASCGGTIGFSQVTITSTFTTPVPQIVLLAAGGTSLSATACFPNNS